MQEGEGKGAGPPGGAGPSTGDQSKRKSEGNGSGESASKKVRVDTLIPASTFFRYFVGCFDREYSRVLRNAGIRSACVLATDPQEMTGVLFQCKRVHGLGV